jgi:hypothetical protein
VGGLAGVAGAGVGVAGAVKGGPKTGADPYKTAEAQRRLAQGNAGRGATLLSRGGGQGLGDVGGSALGGRPAVYGR